MCINNVRILKSYGFIVRKQTKCQVCYFVFHAPCFIIITNFSQCCSNSAKFLKNSKNTGPNSDLLQIGNRNLVLQTGFRFRFWRNQLFAYRVLIFFSVWLLLILFIFIWPFLKLLFCLLFITVFFIRVHFFVIFYLLFCYVL